MVSLQSLYVLSKCCDRGGGPVDSGLVLINLGLLYFLGFLALANLLITKSFLIKIYLFLI